MVLHRVWFAMGLAMLVAAPATVANATSVPVFSESFENCTHDDSPTLTGITTALDDPITVDIWWNVAAVCPDWSTNDGAWLIQHVSGPAFPDGDFALWLNEYPESSASVTVGGLTMDTEYTIEFDAWTDNDPADTSLILEYVTAAAIPSTTFELPGRSGPTHFTETFTTDVEETVLFFYGATGIDASPIIDNISVTATSDGADDSMYKSDSLAQTGFNPVLLALSGTLFLIGGTTLAIRRLWSRN